MQVFYFSGISTLRMNDDEIESKFDNLVSTVSLGLGTQLLTRVPSVKNMGVLETLYLETNKITMIGPEDFKGANSLVVLTLGGNSIVSIATSAFTNLELFRVRPEEFNPTNADGTPYTNALGIRTFVYNVCGRDLALQETPTDLVILNIHHAASSH